MGFQSFEYIRKGIGSAKPHGDERQRKRWKATAVTRFRIQVFEGQGRRARAYQVSEPRNEKEQTTPYTENEKNRKKMLGRNSVGGRSEKK